MPIKGPCLPLADASIGQRNKIKYKSFEEFFNFFHKAESEEGLISALYKTIDYVGYTLTRPVHGRPLIWMVVQSPRRDFVTAVLSIVTTVSYQSANIVTDARKGMLGNTRIILIGNVFTMILSTHHMWRIMSGKRESWQKPSTISLIFSQLKERYKVCSVIVHVTR
jgi:hypothetical protein